MDKDILLKKESFKEYLFLADLMGYDIEKYKKNLENLDKLNELEIKEIKDFLNTIEEITDFIGELSDKYDYIDDPSETMKWMIGGLTLVGVGVITFMLPQNFILENINQKLMKQIIKKSSFFENEIEMIDKKVSEILNITIEIKNDVEMLKEQIYIQNAQKIKEICYNIENYIEKIKTKHLYINDLKIDELFNRAITILEEELKKISNRKGIPLNIYLISNLYVSLIIFFEIISSEKRKIGENNYSYKEKLIEVGKEFLNNNFLDNLRDNLIMKGLLDNKKLNMIEEFFVIKQQKLLEKLSR